MLHTVGPATEKTRFPTCSHVCATVMSPDVKHHREAGHLHFSKSLLCFWHKLIRQTNLI